MKASFWRFAVGPLATIAMAVACGCSTGWAFVDPGAGRILLLGTVASMRPGSAASGRAM